MRKEQPLDVEMVAKFNPVPRLGRRSCSANSLGFMLVLYTFGLGFPINMQRKCRFFD